MSSHAVFTVASELKKSFWRVQGMGYTTVHHEQFDISSGSSLHWLHVIQHQALQLFHTHCSYFTSRRILRQLDTEP